MGPYDLNKEEREGLLLPYYKYLTQYHYDNCPDYKRILNTSSLVPYDIGNLSQIPFVPVRLFKLFDLLSVDKSNVVKTLTSSGTSGQKVSKIYLDAENVKNQSKVLNIIISSYIGSNRLPLILLDTDLVKKDRKMYSARGAGIIGFSLFGRDPIYALDENFDFQLTRVMDYINKNRGKKILLFGYTYLIWKYVVNFLEPKGLKLDIKDGVLFHIGGWKKLKQEEVSSKEFNRRVKACLGEGVKIYNYYGMAEQLGSVFVECEEGHMHCSVFSDVFIREPEKFGINKVGEKGLIQLLSVLPTSYPGHSILTEDEGVLLGEDDCPCGRKGKYFKILGRVKNAEIRGCSDTFEKR